LSKLTTQNVEQYELKYKQIEHIRNQFQHKLSSLLRFLF